MAKLDDGAKQARSYRELLRQRQELAKELKSHRARFETLRRELGSVPGAEAVLAARQREIEQVLVLAEKRLRGIDYQIETIGRPTLLQ